MCSVIGAGAGYLIGYFVWWNNFGEFSKFAFLFFKFIPGFSIESFANIQSKYELWNFWIIFTAGFTPIPFKLFTISAGAFKINFVAFLLASFVGRSARFFLVSLLIKKFGEPIKTFIDSYFNVLAILFSILLVGGFLIIKAFV